MIHRKIIILTAFLFAISFEMFAQVKPFRFGVKFIPNITWMRPQTDGYESEGAQVGLGWGFISDITLTDNYFLATGFDMEWNNAKLYYPDKEEGIDQEGMLYRQYKLKSIDIPFSVKMRTNQFDNFAFFGQLGITVGFRIGAKAEDQFEYVNQNQQTILTPVDENQISDDISLVKSSVLFGGGVEFYIDESTSLVASLCYKNGLTNILNGTNDIDSSLKEKAVLNCLQLNLGVIF